MYVSGFLLNGSRVEFKAMGAGGGHHHHHHHHHMNIIRVSYIEQLREHWTRSKKRDANATVWQSRQGSRKEVRLVTLESGYRWRVCDEGRQRVPDASPGHRSPTVVLRVGGTTRAGEDVDPSRRLVPLSATRRSSSDRYAGAVPCRQRKTSTESLNSIRSDTCSQWRSRSSGVMCSNCELLSFSSVNLWFDLNYIHYKMH